MDGVDVPEEEGRGGGSHGSEEDEETRRCQRPLIDILLVGGIE